MRNGLSTWMSSPRQSGCTRANMRLLVETKGAHKEMGRIVMITYFLANELGIKDVWPLLQSVTKQRAFLWKAMKELKAYKVEDGWVEPIAENIEKVYERAARVMKIVEENLRLTDYWPYFEDVGFKRLIDFAIDYPEDPKEANEVLKAEIADYNSRHAGKVKAYSESIAERKAAIEARKQTQIEDVKLNRKAAKVARKLADAEVKEIQKNEEKHRARERKIERSFAYLYK